MSATDCNLRALVEGGYGALFGPHGGFATVLTVAMTLYIALVGYQLMLGRGRLSVGELSLTAVKLGAVLALATQWTVYDRLVYRLAFDGPQELAQALQGALGGAHSGDLFAALQHAFDDLTLFSPAAPPGPNHRDPFAAAGLLPSATPMQMTPASFDALLLLISAGTLLLSTLGALLVAKIVLAVLLALGPVFLLLLLFSATRGLFVGWLRATLACAATPLLITLVAALGLRLLDPYLAQIELMQTGDRYIPGVAMPVLVLTLILAGAGLGIALAAGAAALGFKGPRFRVKSAPPAARSAPAASPRADPQRPDRVSGTVSAMQRQDAAVGGRRIRFDPAEFPAPNARLGSVAERRTVRPRARPEG